MLGEEGRDDEERGLGGVAWDRPVDGRELGGPQRRVPSVGPLSDLDASGRAREHRPRCGPGSRRARSTVVGPSAARRREQDGRLHLGARDRQLVADGAQRCRRRPRGAGGRRSPTPRTVAPIWPRGRATRSIGRRRSEASPSRWWVPSIVATTPHSRRIVVPEFPHSSIAVLGTEPVAPAVDDAPCRRHAARRRRRARARTPRSTRRPRRSSSPSIDRAPLGECGEEQRLGARSTCPPAVAARRPPRRGGGDLDEVGDGLGRHAHSGSTEVRSPRASRRSERARAPSASSTMMSTPEVPSWEWAISRS